MEEKSFRVLLDFREINYGVTDLKYVWMFVSPRELKTILDFKRDVIRKFPFIEENVKLFVRDGLLLENEKIAILREDDTVKLQYDECSVSNYSIQVSTEDSGRAEPIEGSSLHKESRKRRSDVIKDNEESGSCSKSLRKKRKGEKSHKTIEPEEIEVCEEIITIDRLENFDKPTKKRKEKHVDQIETTLNGVLETVSGKCNKKQAKEFSSGIDVSMNSSSSFEKTYKVTEIFESYPVTNSNIENIPIVQNESDCINDTFEVVSSENVAQQDSSQKKRKRKRRRKRKEPIQDPSLVEEEETPQNINNTTVVDQSSNNRKHIIYNSSKPSLATVREETLNSFESPVPTNNSTNNLSNDRTNSRNSLSADHKTQSSSSSKTDGHLKSSTPFSKKQHSIESWCITPLMNTLNDQASSSLSNLESSKEKKKSAKETLYEDYPLLNIMPTVGTRVAYKTLQLSENYCPEVSQYKEGIVKNVNSYSEDLEIELIQEEIKQGRTGKFEIYCEDEVPPPEIVKNVTINWTNMIEPRLICN